MSSEISSTASQDFSEFGLIFCPSDLDDAGLTPAEFRIYCHLARRAGSGVAFCGIRSMAEVCQLNKDTVLASIEILEHRRMITVKRTPGSNSHYRLTPKSAWVSEKREHLDRSLKPDTLSPQTGHTVRNEGTKGTPLKVIPKDTPTGESCGDVELPAGFPKTEAAAIAMGSMIGCSKEFTVKIWDLAVSRGGRDHKDVIIRSFSHHLKIQKTYAEEHAAKETKYGKSRNEPPSRNEGTHNNGDYEKYRHLEYGYKPPQGSGPDEPDQGVK